jgi:ubiquinone/menaquinone biosynthesis C-methylase UbiE
MKTTWDYTSLAETYDKRPEYAPTAIDHIIETAGLKPGDRFCDIGAGTGKLTCAFLARKMVGVSVEPNDAMRNFGTQNTTGNKCIKWVHATAENTGQAEHSFSLVSFGSSFNVVNQERALKEAARLLMPGGWMACLWNHRQLDDPIQQKIEGIIKTYIEIYDYGSRRRDQTKIIKKSRLFDTITKFEHDVTHLISISDWMEAWRSHATLERQSAGKFYNIISEIEIYLQSLDQKIVEVPYTSRAWMARLK